MRRELTSDDEINRLKVPTFFPCRFTYDRVSEASSTFSISIFLYCSFEILGDLLVVVTNRRRTGLLPSLLFHLLGQVSRQLNLLRNHLP
jgi:hypothetical protein